MDRAHRLGQMRPVHVYRLALRGTIEERILQRAQQKAAVQSLVMAQQPDAKEGCAPAQELKLG